MKLGKKRGLQLGLGLLIVLTGCGYALTSRRLVEDAYVYYPDYQMYRNNHGDYTFASGGFWMTSQAPGSITPAALGASRRVSMKFHDSPVNHHAAMTLEYPCAKLDKPDGRQPEIVAVK
jgi:hypothetical protein